MTYKQSSWDPNYYDVTVTLYADGPTGVKVVQLWINGDNAMPLDLINIPGTKKWQGTTNYYTPLPPGQYYIDQILLYDNDPFTQDELRTGWYIMMPNVSTSKYFVDERITKGVSFLFYNYGLTDFNITSFALP